MSSTDQTSSDGISAMRHLSGGSALGVASACLYGGTAVSMNFINKMALQVYPLSNIIMIGQMCATYAVLHPLLMAGVLDFAPFSWRRCRQLCLVTVLYTLNTAFALVSFQSLNIPIYNTLKRLTPMIVLVCKACLQRQWPRTQVCLSVLLVVAGCIFAGLGDLRFDALGYLYALLSCTTQAAYLLVVEFQGSEGVETTELLYYNAITALPLLGLLVVADGEAAKAMPTFAGAVQRHGMMTFWLTMGSCCFCGMLLNYALFLCTVNNSALMTTIVGVLKSVVAVGLGFFLLGGVKVTTLLLIGIAMNTAGGIWYTVIRYQEKGLSRRSIALPAADGAEAKPLLKNKEGSHA